MPVDVPVNGQPSGGHGKYIDTVDPDDPDYQRRMMRPAEIKEDMQQMQHRKRVSNAIGSDYFRNEMEDIVKNAPASLAALKQMLTPQSGANFSGRSAASAPVIAINDLRGPDAASYNKAEKIMRCKLASLYRLVDLFGWSQGIYNHITYRLSQEHEHFLVNPYGLMYHEITASSLAKVDMQGNSIDSGSTTLSINKIGFQLHSAIHSARPDIKCIIHLHTTPVVAVSVMKSGLLPVSHEALILGEISYYDRYHGYLNTTDEIDDLARALGPNNKVLILRQHGAVACGETLEEAFHWAYSLNLACEAQIKVAALGLDNLVVPSVEVQEDTKAFSCRVHDTDAGTATGGGGGDSKAEPVFQPGQLLFSAYMRHLDNAGFRTGYLYPKTLVGIQSTASQKAQSQPPKGTANDVQIPPTSTNFAHTLEEGFDLGSPYKYVRKAQRHEWIYHTPNAYTKKEFEETGTDQPKKYSKWVDSGDGSPSKSPVRTSNPNQFAPQGVDPKELKDAHKNVRKGYYEDDIHAGPQSRILEGMTWKEAQDKSKEGAAPTGESVIVVGAASKGIIQRDQQHNVAAYQSEYEAANPFANVNETDLEQYKRDIAAKNQSPQTDDAATTPTEEHPHGEVERGTVEAGTVEARPARHEPPPPPPVRSSSRPVVQRSLSDEKIDKSAAGGGSPRSAANKSGLFGRGQFKSERKPKSGGRNVMNDSTDTGAGIKSTDDETEDEAHKRGDDKKGGKKKFRMPSFSSKKEKKKK